MGRRLWSVVGLAFGIAGVLVACDDSSTDGGGGGTVADSGPDTSTSQPRDGSTGTDGASAVDSGSKENDAGDAGSTLTTSLGSTGVIGIYNELVFANFYEDETIVRAPGTPECVMYIRSESKPSSAGGKLTVGGPIVGSDGGTETVIEIMPNEMNQYEHLGPIFPSDDALLVQVESVATSTFPSMPVQSLRPPPASPVVLTKPSPPDGGAPLAISSTQAFEIAWEVPAGAKADLRMGFHFIAVNVEGTPKQGFLYCGFPLSAGKGTVPTALLAEMKSRVGPNATGLVSVFVGGQKEFATPAASYVIEVTRFDSTPLELEGQLN